MIIAREKRILDCFKKEDVDLGTDSESVGLWEVGEVVLPDTIGILEF